jgi:hypothetical protein
VTLEIVDQAGTTVRRYSSDDPTETLGDESNVPAYWIRPTLLPSTRAGMHRFVWDLHYTPPQGMTRSFPIAAVYHNTPREPNGVWALPGSYTVRLTVDGHVSTERLTVAMDPRVKTPAAVLLRQFRLSKQLADAIAAVASAKLDPDVRTRTLAALQAAYSVIQEADVAPTAAAVTSATSALADARREMQRR